MADTFVCTFELNKTAGITVKLVNQTKQITQTVTLDGTAITLKFDNAQTQKSSTVTQKDESVVTEVKDQANTSTLTQKADSVTVVCKTFEVDAETLTLKSSKDTSHKATGKYTVTAQDDLSVTGSKNGTVKTTMNLNLEATQNLTAKATQNLSLEGLEAAMKAQTKASVDGQTQVEIKGLQIAATAQAALTLEGEITSVGKSLTTVKGQMVNVQGSLVKLG
jgi:hypothetical protein